VCTPACPPPRFLTYPPTPAGPARPPHGQQGRQEQHRRHHLQRPHRRHRRRRGRGGTRGAWASCAVPCHAMPPHVPPTTHHHHSPHASRSSDVTACRRNPQGQAEHAAPLPTPSVDAATNLNFQSILGFWKAQGPKALIGSRPVGTLEVCVCACACLASRSWIQCTSSLPVVTSA
jgi:hypothetical protein